MKVTLSGVVSAVAAASGDFQLWAQLVQRVLWSMQTMMGKQVQAPAIVPHEWLSVLDLQFMWDLPNDHLECIVGPTLASLFGWRASSVYSVPIASIHQGPLERGCSNIEFSTSVFKASPIYPVGWLALGGFPGSLERFCSFLCIAGSSRGARNCLVQLNLFMSRQLHG